MQRSGLKLVTREQTHTLPIPVAEKADWTDGDIALLCMKSQDTEAALRTIPEGTPIFCVQNAVANERMALRHLADVYGVCVMFPTEHLEPGVVVQHSWPTPGLLPTGRFPSGVDRLAETVAKAFRDAGFLSDARPDIMRWKYRKLLMNLGNAVQAVCAEDYSEITKQVRAEGTLVLERSGIEVASEAEDRAMRADVLQVAETRVGGSSWQSLARGTGSIEADYLNGEIVLLGRLAGIATPWNDHARRLANLFARQALPPASMAPSEWLSKLDL